MRTLQEKYNGVLEGNFSKEQFRRDAAMQLPNIVSKFNSFEDMATILKNRGMIAEAVKPMHSSEYAKTDAKPEDHISLDLIDAGIKCELDEKFGRLDVSEEDYENAKATAIKNLSKDPLYYIKKDSEEMPEMGEKMEKAELNEDIFRTIGDRIKQAKHDRWIKYLQRNVQPAKDPKELSSDDIQDMIDQEAKTNSVGDILDAAVHGTIDLKNATPEQIKMFVSIARDSDFGHDTVTGDTHMHYLEKLPNYREAAIKVSEETALDRAQDNAATKVQNTLGDIADTVAEKPASVAAAFRKKVLADPVKYAKMSASELEKEFEAFKLEEQPEPETEPIIGAAVENPNGVTIIKYHTGNPYSGKSFEGEAFVAYVKNDQANALPARGSVSGGHKNLQTALDSLTRSRILHKHSESGKYEPAAADMEVYIMSKAEAEKLFPKLDFKPKEGPSSSAPLDEKTQLKELFKKIITKVLTEEVLKVGEKVDVKPGIISRDEYTYNVEVVKINGDNVIVKDSNDDTYEVPMSHIVQLK